MAFLGFKTSAAGHFAIKHFHGSFLKNCKLRVEQATGLNDSTVTRNLQKRAERTGQSMPSYIKQDATAAEQPPQGEGDEGEGEPSKKRARDPTEETAEERDPSVPLTEEEKRRQKRKEEFVASRMKQTSSGPSWSGEVLVPVTSADNATGDGDANSLAEDHLEVKDPELEQKEKELNAFEQQEVLGTVDDMDFLAGLAASSATPAVKVAAPARHLDDDDDDEARDTATPFHHHHSTAATMAAGGRTGNNNNIGDTPSALPSTAPVAAENQEEVVRRSLRILLKGVPFAASEDDVKNFITSNIGPVSSIHIPLTRDTKQSKGCAFVKFFHEDDAVKCLSSLSGAVFMGRLVRPIAVEEDPYSKKADEQAVRGSAQGPLSEFKASKAQQKQELDATGISWNATYMNSHTAVETMAKRIGVKTTDIVSMDAAGAAVRAAVTEAFLTSEVKAVLGDEGIDLDAITTASALKPRSNTTILVKNLSPKADITLLSKMFQKFGSIDSTAVPSSGSFALYRFLHAQDARVAFQRLSYKVFAGQPLFLEWAPVGSLREADDLLEGEIAEGTTTAPASSSAEQETTLHDKVKHLTLFVSNIPVGTRDDQWQLFLQDVCPRLVKDFDRLVERVSLQTDKSRCFITCKDESTFRYILSKLHGRSFSGKTLSCVASKSTATSAAAIVAQRPEREANDEQHKHTSSSSSTSAARVPPGCNPLKVIVKNLPFEATEKDLRELFAAFTEIKAVRVPKKVNAFSAHRENNHRGFGFVEFLTEEEAAAAIKALSSTHLYGRHLVLQYAKSEE